jgi:hypothetical protein
MVEAIHSEVIQPTNDKSVTIPGTMMRRETVCGQQLTGDQYTWERLSRINKNGKIMDSIDYTFDQTDKVKRLMSVYNKHFINRGRLGQMFLNFVSKSAEVFGDWIAILERSSQKKLDDKAWLALSAVDKDNIEELYYRKIIPKKINEK